MTTRDDDTTRITALDLAIKNGRGGDEEATATVARALVYERFLRGDYAPLTRPEGGEVVLTGEFDAAVWAREFVERAKADPRFALDEGTMLAWFANAIMAGFDRARAQYDPEYHASLAAALSAGT